MLLSQLVRGKRHPNLGSLAALLAACASSPPVQFFTLDPSAGNVAAADPAPDVPLQVARVRIPPSLDRQQIVREPAPSELQISDQYRWSAPLDQMIERTLTLDLRQRLPPRSVLPPGTAIDTKARRIVITIDRFMPVPSGDVELVGNWSVLAAGGKIACADDVALSMRPASSSYAAQVEAMNTLLARLAMRIASTTSESTAASAGCST